MTRSAELRGYADPSYVSPRTLRRRRGRSMRKARRLTRVRIGTLVVDIRAVTTAFAGFGFAMSGVDAAVQIAYSRMKALEEEAARAAIEASIAGDTPWDREHAQGHTNGDRDA